MMLCGELGALSKIISVAFWGVVSFGEKVTATLQLLPGASFLLLHWPLRANALPGGVTVSICTITDVRDFLLLAFLIEIFLGLLVFPTSVVVPNATEGGLTETLGIADGVDVGVAVRVAV